MSAQPNTQSAPQPSGQQPQDHTNSQHQIQQQLQRHKTRMMPLVRYLKQHGLKFKHAECMNDKIQYFRMDHLRQILTQQQPEIDFNPTLKQLVSELNNQLIFLRRPKNILRFKYPSTLIPSQIHTRSKFAAFNFDISEPRRSYMVAFLVVVVCVVMFPLWPYEIKYALWIISMVLLVTIIAIVILRLILYVAVAPFGISLWLFPKFFGDYTVLDSLWPMLSYERWDSSWQSTVLRILFFILFAYYSFSVYQEPEFYLDSLGKTEGVIKELHDWGVGKIKGETGNFSQSAITMEKILNDTEDAFGNHTSEHQQTTQHQQQPQQQQTAL